MSGKAKELHFMHSENLKLLNQMEGNVINNCNFLACISHHSHYLPQAQNVLSTLLLTRNTFFSVWLTALLNLYPPSESSGCHLICFVEQVLFLLYLSKSRTSGNVCVG